MLYDAWHGNTGPMPQSISRAGVLVHATRWPGLPGPAPHTLGFRHLNVLRTTHAGHAAEDAPASLTLLSRGLANLLGRNTIAFEDWAWEDMDLQPWISNKTPLATEQGAPASGPIMLAAAGLTDGDILCAMARDGMSVLRDHGCGCMQSQAGPALKFGFEMSQLAANLRSLNASHGESASFKGRNEWGQCQRGGNFFCDALKPPGWHRSATDGSCVTELAPAGQSVRRRQCGSSMCAWRATQAAQMITAQVAAIRAWQDGTLETLKVRYFLLPCHPALLFPDIC